MAKFVVPWFPGTLAWWLNTLLETGFLLERVGEPRPTDEAVCEYPNVQDAQVVAYFLHLRMRKPPFERFALR